jgi:ATP-dependent exoDNAse (exonuclease V) alpha subunit
VSEGPLRILSKPSQEAIMAIYHFDASVISRSKGRSATAASAYRTAEVIKDHRTGEVHDYTRKGGVLHTEIIAPDTAPAWVHDRSSLWNAVEDAERRKDAQVAREVRVALPSELSTEQNADLVRAFVREQFVARGMIADVALHAPGREGDQRNHHAHIMLTTRAVSPEGFGAKERDWNAKDLLVDWRGSWAEHVNDTLERCDIHERVDHRTLVAQRADALSLAHDAKERGDDHAQAEHMARAVELDRPALPGMSAGSWSMMRRGLTTPAAERWQEVKQIAAQAREIAAEFKDWARDWLERLVDGMQERTVAVGPSARQREPQTALEQLQAARAGRSTTDVPQTALEKLQAARDSRHRDTGADVVRNEERAGHELQSQDAERERALEQERERVREQERTAEREGPRHGR